MADVTLNDIVSLCKRRGIVFHSSEVYGGWEATYDFGPVGAEMLHNLRNLWWKEFIQSQKNMVGLDSAIISHPRVWEASGHVESFADAMVEDLETHKRYRADHLVDEALDIVSDGYSLDELDKVIEENKILSPDGNPLSKAKYFNQLVEVKVGTTENSKSVAYLRGETCQPIFYNFELVQQSSRQQIPFGIGQIGKAFRNEIKVGPYFFRTREFEQMEIELFVRPDDWEPHIDRFKKWSIEWLKSLGISESKMRLRDQEFKERAHYNKVATDVEYEFSYGWKEFQGIHYRGDWDLKRHGEFSGKDFTYTEPKTGEKYIPHVVEYSIGLSRLLLVLISDAYTVEEKDGKSRIVLRLDPKVAAYKAAVFPLMANKPELVDKADAIYQGLLKQYPVAWDARGNVGKRYYYQDEIGTPYCITVDYESLEDDTVTVRDRDTAEQVRLSIEDLDSFLAEKLA